MKSKLKGAVRETRNRSKTDPLITVKEAVINSIQASSSPDSSHIKVRIIYDTSQHTFDSTITDTTGDNKPFVRSFEITDDGQGFTEQNLESFEELYSDHKKGLGCKGIGRVSWLAVFDHVEVDSICTYNGQRSHVSFLFDEEDEVNQKKIESTDELSDRTIVRLVGVRQEFRDSVRVKAERLASILLEHCLSYYISGCYPDIVVQDDEGSISVTDLYSLKGYKVSDDSMVVKGRNFTISHLLARSTKTKSNAAALYCANSRVVKSEEILKSITLADADSQYYTYVACIRGDYLDENVMSDRLDFSIPSEKELHDPQEPTLEDIKGSIESAATKYLGPTIQSYLDKCLKRADEFVQGNPEFRYVLANRPDIIKEISPTADESELYRVFNKEFADIESEYVFDFKSISDGTLKWDSEDERSKIFEKINATQQATLAKYMSHRKYMINLFEKQLNVYLAADGKQKYSEECKIHDMIMPKHTEANQQTLDNCNLWMIDERLNYYSFSSSYSDKQFKQFTDINSKERPDICIFSDKRGDHILAVTIIELKRPDRTDSEVLDQVKGYVRKLKDGMLKDYHGRAVKISKEAVYYCYILCDIDEKRYGEYLQGEDFSRIYSGRSYYKWYSSLSAHIEFIDYDHLLSDMKVRNSIFFKIMERTYEDSSN